MSDTPKPRQWPTMVPTDLRHRLDLIARYREPPKAAEIWDTVREWLEAHDVQPPDHDLPTDNLG